jgi:hypothetical protein
MARWVLSLRNFWRKKTLKTELRLKSYESLNFQGIKRKNIELKIDFLLKLGTKF